MNAVAKYFASIDDGAGSLGPFMMLAQDKAALQTWSVWSMWEEIYMFESVPQGDAILMMVLKNCYVAIPNDGKVIVEEVLPFEPLTTGAVKSISQFDVLMMTTNPGARREREK
ncbi:hypothetical protein JHK86_017630 [Glycine max]|nr:hypothetical protein JHK86_017630 [Glycine max]